MKCDLCNGTGKLLKNWYDTTGLMTHFKGDICFMCDGKGTVGEPMTNEEYLRFCNTEQLAEWICSVHEKCYYCGAKRISDRERCPFGDGKCRNNKHEFAMWLKQPHDAR